MFSPKKVKNGKYVKKKKNGDGDAGVVEGIPGGQKPKKICLMISRAMSCFPR